MKRVALLIDGDNIKARHDAELRYEAEKLGRLDIARIHGGTCLSNEWSNASGLRFIYAGVGKNAADLLLSIDAMELALSEGIEVFAMASSDGDFTHLAQRLREKGFHVLGLGNTKAPERLRKACCDFHVLREREACAEKVETSGKTRAAVASLSFDEKIRKVIKQNDKNGKGIAITELLRQMRSTYETKISAYPER